MSISFHKLKNKKIFIPSVISRVTSALLMMVWYISAAYIWPRKFLHEERHKHVKTKITDNNGPLIDLQIPGWYRTEQTLMFTVKLDGAVGTVDMKISYSDDIPVTQPETGSGSGGSMTIRLLLLLMFSRLITSRIRISFPR